MKAIRFIEKTLVLIALLTLVLKIFNLCPTIILFYTWLALSLFYLFFSYWIFFERGKFVIISILIGLGFGFCFLGWMPPAFGWPINQPFYLMGIVTVFFSLIFLLILEILKKRIHKFVWEEQIKKAKLISRFLIFISITGFLYFAPRDIVYSLIARNNIELKLYQLIGKLNREGNTDQAISILNRQVDQNSDADMYRLFGEVLLAKGDTAGAIIKYKESIRRDTFEHGNSIALTEIINLTYRNSNKKIEQKRFGKAYKVTPFTPFSLNDDWQLAVPESEGLSSQILSELFKQGENIPQLVSLIVIKNDKIIAERYYQYSPMHLNATFSAWKSIVSTMIGIAVDKGYIKNVDQKLPEFFPDYNYTVNDPRKEITIRNLLTMTSGITGNDYGDYFISKDPVKSILEKPIKGEPGNVFRYLTQNMIMAIRIIEKGSGMKFDKFCHKYCDSLNILRPYYPDSILNIYNKNIPDVKMPFSWDGTYLTLRDLAKFGSMFLHYGKFKNIDVVTKKWMKEATKEQVDFNNTKVKVESPTDDYLGYGYFFWLKNIRGHPTFAARGWGGQTIICVPDKDLVIASFGSEWDRSGGYDIERLVFELTEVLCQ